jgi:DNA-binding response OmpR family regulator
MDKKRIVLICDNDEAGVQTISQALTDKGYAVSTLNDATSLVSEASRQRPSAIIVNPDLNGFNEYDICKKLIQEINIPVILIVNKDSTARAQIGDCSPIAVMEKPVVISNLINEVEQQIAISSNE